MACGLGTPGHLDTWIHWTLSPGQVHHLEPGGGVGDAENRYDEGGAALAVAGQSNRRLRPLVVRYS